MNLNFKPAMTPNVTYDDRNNRPGKRWLASSYAERLELLILDAAEDGIVLTVELEPVAPLAMGNYVMRGHVRGA